VGVGGGGMFVPLLGLIFGFDLKASTALSQACLAGGSSTALVYNLWHRHPSGHGPLIDYDIVLVMGPSMLIGSLAGSAMHAALPTWFILALLVVVLGYSCLKTTRKGLQMWRREAASRLATGAPARVPGADDARSLAVNVDEATGDASAEIGDAPPPETSAHPGLLFPPCELSLFLGTWAAVLGSTFARGGRDSPGVVGYCTPEYWAMSVGTAMVLAGVAAIGARRAGGKQRRQPLPPPSPAYDLAMVARLVLSSALAGVVAALCGIGGGMVMGPLLLELGVPPQVQTASMAATLFVTSTTTALFFVVQGTAPPGYAFFLAASTGVGAIFGVSLMAWAIRRSGRPSLAVLLLAGVIGVSLFVMTAVGGTEVSGAVARHESMGFRPVCGD